MFTGIVETTGALTQLEGGRLTLSTPWETEDIRIGQSVSVDGCCLTVVHREAGTLGFDVSPETLKRTTLGRKKRSDLVNLERGMRLGESLDGHLVTGHIDSTVKIRSIREVEKDTWEMWIDVARDGLPWLVEKGSVALDGISLTVNEVDAKGFTVMLIPHTLEITSLHTRKAGNELNIEYDLIAKYVARLTEGARLAMERELSS